MFSFSKSPRVAGLLLPALISALAFFRSTASAQITDQEAFTTDDGLPSNQIRSLAQTADGRLWAGTENGLSYYFGGRFHAEPGGGVINFPVQAMFADSAGNLWTGSEAGLLLRTANGDWSPGPEQLTDGGVLAIRSDSQGRIWAGGRSGLMVLENGAWEPVTIPGTDSIVTGLAIDSADRVWASVMTSNGTEVFVLSDGEIAASFTEADGLNPALSVNILEAGPGDTVWLGTNLGLYGFDAGSLQITFLGTADMKSNVIAAILPDLEGGLMVGTSFGLDYLDPISGELLPPPWPVPPTGKAVQALLTDKEGGLWIGTNSGLIRMNASRWREDLDPAVSRVEIIGLLETQTGDIYALTRTSLAVKSSTSPMWRPIASDNETGRFFTISRAEPRPELSPRAPVQVGAETGLFFVTEEGLVRDNRLKGVLAVSAILVGHNSVTWVGTNLGLYRSAGGDFERVAEFGESGIAAIWQSQSGGRLWVAVNNAGVFHFSNGAWENLGDNSSDVGLISDIVLAGLSASNGSIWLGTDVGPMWVPSDRDPGRVTSWMPLHEQAIAGTRVNALAEARGGQVWIGTQTGLFLSDGELTTEFQIGPGPEPIAVTSLLRDRADLLWVGTAGGLFVHQDYGIPPQIEIDSLDVAGEPCGEECFTGPLPYNAETATLYFTGSDLGDPDGIAYRVEISTISTAGESTTTMPPIRESTHSFDLIPGTAYELSVQAIDRDFNQSAFSEPLRFEVAAPTWWDRLRDHPAFPLVAVFGIITTSAGIVVGRRAWINRDPMGYSDLLVALRRESQAYRVDYELDGRHVPGSTSVQLNPEWLVAAQKRIEGQEVGESALKDLGDALYSAIFPEQSLVEIAGGSAYRQLRPVRIRLKIDEPELAGLPWELAFSEAFGFIGSRTDTPLVRSTGKAEPDESRPLTGRLRVLAVLARPDHPDLPPLNLAAEREILEKAAAGNRRLEIGFIAGVRAAAAAGLEPAQGSVFEAVAAALETDAPWDVLHFVCHTGRERLPWGDLGELSLGMEDAAGRYDPMGPTRLGPLLESLRAAGRSPRLAVLNACRTSAAAGGLSEVFIRGKVAAVIGMQWAIQDAASAAFTGAFYSNLLRHGQIDHAVSAGRNGIARALGAGQRDWAAPVLFATRRDGFLFKRD